MTIKCGVKLTIPKGTPRMALDLKGMGATHVELSNSKLDSILLEEDVEDLGRCLQLVWDLHHRLQYGGSLFGIHSNILGSSLLVFLCRALIASFLSRSTLTWLCLQTINFWAALFLFLGWASNPYHTMHKTSQELQKLPAQVSWKVQFKCQICPSCLSWVSCLSWWPWWPWRAWLQW